MSLFTLDLACAAARRIMQGNIRPKDCDWISLSLLSTHICIFLPGTFDFVGACGSAEKLN